MLTVCLINTSDLQAQTDSTIIDTVACDSLVSPSGKYVWTETGDYIDTMTNSTGGDSLLFISLTVPEIMWQLWYAISGTGMTVFTNATGFQWLDCDNNMSPVFGATTGTMYGSPWGGGTFACELDSLGCKDTTDCGTIIGTGIDEPTESSFQVFPNPADNYLDVRNETSYTNYEITDLKGRVARQGNILSNNRIDISTLARGSYLMKIKDNQEKVMAVQSFLKQ